jgi:hypothetical protein
MREKSKKEGRMTILAAQNALKEIPIKMLERAREKAPIGLISIR